MYLTGLVQSFIYNPCNVSDGCRDTRLYLSKYTLLVLIASGSFCLDEGDSLQLASQMTPVVDDPARVRRRSDVSALITWQTAADRGGATPGETKPGSWGRVQVRCWRVAQLAISCPGRMSPARGPHVSSSSQPLVMISKCPP